MGVRDFFDYVGASDGEVAVCKECSAVVFVEEVHLAWHERIGDHLGWRAEDAGG